MNPPEPPSSSPSPADLNPPVRKRVAQLGREAMDAVFDLEVLATNCAGEARFAWMEAAIRLVRILARDLREAAGDEPAPASTGPGLPPVEGLDDGYVTSPSGALGAHDCNRSILETRQTLLRLHESLQRALRKQPRITGTLRRRLQHHRKDLVAHVALADPWPPEADSGMGDSGDPALLL